jgi:hypothetical protein
VTGFGRISGDCLIRSGFFLEKCKSIPNLDTFLFKIRWSNLGKEWVWPHFGRFFSQARLVALLLPDAPVWRWTPTVTFL